MLSYGARYFVYDQLHAVADYILGERQPLVLCYRCLGVQV